MTRININGLNNTEDIEKLGSHYQIHPLTLEDIVNTSHRPKLEEFENYMFLVFKMLSINTDGAMSYEHISLIIGEDYVLTFQEADGDVLFPRGRGLYGAGWRAFQGRAGKCRVDQAGLSASSAWRLSIHQRASARLRSGRRVV